MNNKKSLSSDNSKSWFESRKPLERVRLLLLEATQEIRIASGFFTVGGWNLIREYTNKKQTYLLVGLYEQSTDNVKLVLEKLVDEIMRSLRTGCDEHRWKAVSDLVQKLQSREFEIVDARAIRHHAKLYIADRNAVIIASSNLTVQGLTGQIEAGNVLRDPREVESLTQKFDEYFVEAKNITEELLEALSKWLQFALPWDIYLKTLLALEAIEPHESCYSKQPVSYQIDMIAQTLRQIRQYSGSMLVASTGLGKTVVAVHIALHLYKEKIINNIVVIAPKPVRKNWQLEMRDAGLPCEYFNRHALDAKTTKNNKNLEDFEEIIKDSNRLKWFLIIDESHDFRNRFKKDLQNRKKNPQERLAFQRLQKLCQAENTKVLLLTGSPYAKEIENINHQLFLLPHTSESEALFPDYVDGDRAWKISEVEEFTKLPVTSLLTTPYVARYYGEKEKDDIYINFGDSKQYIPKIILNTVTFPLPLQAELTFAFSEGYFDLDSPHHMGNKNIRTQARVAWTSSLRALEIVLVRTMDTPDGENSYNLENSVFRYSQLERQHVLHPVLTKLQSLKPKDDIKLQTLVFLLDKAEKESKKVIIFCERHSTVAYLCEGLESLLPSFKIVTTIESGEGICDYKLKGSQVSEEIIKRFSPIANNAKIDNENFNVLICTDAHGVGLNLQDASVVINYDIDWTPVTLIQRAGRILRFWHSPRTIEIYTFVPSLQTNRLDLNKNLSDIKQNLLDIRKRWIKLMDRHNESNKIIELPVLTEQNTQQVDVAGIASPVTIKSGNFKLTDLGDLEISPYYYHTAKLQQNRDRAERLSSDLVSAKIGPVSTPKIYVLLLHQGKYNPILCNISNGNLEFQSLSENEILDLIACDRQTEIARSEFDEVDRLGNACIELWCSSNSIPPEEVERICTLYIKPEIDLPSQLPGSDTDFKRMIVLLGNRTKSELLAKAKKELVDLIGEYPSSEKAEVWKTNLKKFYRAGHARPTKN